MCNTVLLSNKISSLSKRSFTRRLDIAKGEIELSSSRFVQLNKNINSLQDMLRTQWNEIGETEYAILGPQIHVLISTLKSLLEDIYTLSKNFRSEILYQDLENSVSELEELDSDIRSFRINIFKNPEFQSIISQASALA